MKPRILGVPADPITFEVLLTEIDTWIQAHDRLHQICTINPEFIMMAQHDRDFYQVLQTADRCVLDGWGAVWALRWRGVDVPERVTGSDGVPLIVARAAEKAGVSFCWVQPRALPTKPRKSYAPDIPRFRLWVLMRVALTQPKPITLLTW